MTRRFEVRKYFGTQTEAETWLYQHTFTPPETSDSYWCDGYCYAEVRYNGKGFFVVKREIW